MTKREPQPALLTADEAAALCGVAKRTWWRLVAKRQVPEPVRLGGSVRWRKGELERWINHGCRASRRGTPSGRRRHA